MRSLFLQVNSPKQDLFTTKTQGVQFGFAHQLLPSFCVVSQDIESVETNETDTFQIVSSSSEEEIKGSQAESQESSDAQAFGNLRDFQRVFCIPKCHKNVPTLLIFFGGVVVTHIFWGLKKTCFMVLWSKGSFLFLTTEANVGTCPQ